MKLKPLSSLRTWLGLSLAASLLLSGCTTTPTPSGASSNQGTVTRLSGDSWCTKLAPQVKIPYKYALGEAISSGQYYVPGFVVVVASVDVDLQQLQSSAGLSDPVDSFQVGTPSGSYVILLYAYNTSTSASPWPTVYAIVDFAVTQGDLLYAEPDYILNPDIPTFSALRWDWEGSPWTPSAGAGGAGVNDYLGQWGLNGVTVATDTGAPDVFVLDSSSFASSGFYQLTAGQDNFDICVTHPQSGPLEDGNSPNPHGLFTAGMVHAASPQARVHLVKVLDGQAHGETFTVLKTLAAIMAIAPSNTPKPIINLSMGIPIEAAMDPEVEKAREGDGGLGDLMSLLKQDDNANTLETRLGLSGEPPSPWNGEPVPMIALHLVTRAMSSDGFLIVAAAGNDNAGQASTLPPEIPARWPEVLAAGASNPERVRACYSNDAQAFPPGGAGQDAARTNGCEPRHESCTDLNCRYAVISQFLGPTSGSFEYRYWVGTSFAAPIASGQAANLEIDGVAPTDIPAQLISSFPP